MVSGDAFSAALAVVIQAHSKHTLKRKKYKNKTHTQKMRILEQKANPVQIYDSCWRFWKRLLATRVARCKTHTRTFLWLWAMKFPCYGKPRDRRAQARLLCVYSISLQKGKFAYTLILRYASCTHLPLQETSFIFATFLTSDFLSHCCKWPVSS